MPHNRNDSTESTRSTASSVLSTSSRISLEKYETLQSAIESVRNSMIPLENLVNAALKLVTEKLAPDSRNICEFTDDKNVSVKLDQVMTAMLSYVRGCGGDDGQRYVTSAILACSGVENVVEALEALGTTWLTHFLFIFKTGNSHRNQDDKRLSESELATPTLEQTASHHRKKSFADDVEKRDGYKCVVTGFISDDHPRLLQLKQPGYTLESSHILCRALGNLKGGLTSQSIKSALITFDILLNFTGLLVKNLEELSDLIDHPTNGMLLEYNAHDGFDRFKWYLQKTDKDDVYDLKKLKLLPLPDNFRVSFEDHSNDFQSNTKKRERSVDLPNPHYFAIHAAIAQVLHYTKAGQFLDGLLIGYQDEDVQSFSELEAVREKKLLLEAVTEAFQSVKS